VELVVVEEAVVLAAVDVVVVVVAPFSPVVSPLAPGAFPGIYPLSSASPGILAASACAYPPWYLSSVASSSSELQLLGQLRLVEAVVDNPSLLVVAGVV
jgi:hypothetical protein